MKKFEQITIRALRPTEIGPLQVLIWETIDRSYESLYPPRAIAYFKEFHGEENILARSRSGKVLVAERAGQLIGTGCLAGEEIFAVFVHPDRQGAGLGKALMRRLEADALAAGVVEARLSVSLPSKQFYEGLGYSLMEACSRDLGEGERLDFWKAKKRLGPT